MDPKKSAGLEILSGWKEIANYLGMAIRTVQRYEGDRGLPIYRPGGHSGGVIATKNDLDGWASGGPTQVGLMRKVRAEHEAARIGAKFLLVDSEIALTFSGIAIAGGANYEKKRRCTQTARTAYDTIMRLRKSIPLSVGVRDKLDANLQRLKSELQSLGQSF
jgi:hypothetical protein